MISHKYGCIFTHIPKTGGTSIEKLLGGFNKLELGVQDHRPLCEIQPLSLIDECRVSINILLGKEVNYHPDLSRKQFRKYFKFSIVRNPWARVHSWYRNTMEDERQRMLNGVPAGLTFKEYLDVFGDHWALQPQLTWLKNRKGRIKLDFVGRFEKLDSDMIHISSKLGLKGEIPHLLDRGVVDYRPAYCKKTHDFVCRKYAEEISLFDYHFE